jgi:hypothetical protein
MTLWSLATAAPDMNLVLVNALGAAIRRILDEILESIAFFKKEIFSIPCWYDNNFTQTAIQGFHTGVCSTVVHDFSHRADTSTEYF